VPRATRRLALSRDNYQCTECGATQDLEVHHIVPRRLGGPDDPSNLITLCAACHSRLHGTAPKSSVDQPSAVPTPSADGALP
jgi:5-methylcytosine-specific restriction endonuclease McrA